MFKMEVQNRIRIDQNAQSIHNRATRSVVCRLFHCSLWSSLGRLAFYFSRWKLHREQCLLKIDGISIFFSLFSSHDESLSRPSERVIQCVLLDCREKRTQKEEEDISEIFISGEEAKNTQQQQNIAQLPIMRSLTASNCGFHASVVVKLA